VKRSKDTPPVSRTAYRALSDLPAILNSDCGDSALTGLAFVLGDLMKARGPGAQVPDVWELLMPASRNRVKCR
jgi:hypothetical protein